MNIHAALRNVRRVELEAKRAVLDPTVPPQMVFMAQLVTKLAEAVQVVADQQHPGLVKIANAMRVETGVDRWEY